jgi:hypothetical protein
MNRIIIVLLSALPFIGCSKSDDPDPAVTPIPDIIQGQVREIDVTPVDINTPGQGSFIISMTGALYKVQFNATTQAESNAILLFANDTMLIEESREFGNFGFDVVAYNPVKENELLVQFNDGGKRIEGQFNQNTSFGGAFGRDLIEQWRETNVPNKPNQKAKDDITNFVSRYADSNGGEVGATPTYLKVTVTRN